MSTPSDKVIAVDFGAKAAPNLDVVEAEVDRDDQSQLVALQQGDLSTSN